MRYGDDEDRQAKSYAAAKPETKLDRDLDVTLKLFRILARDDDHADRLYALVDAVVRELGRLKPPRDVGSFLVRLGFETAFSTAARKAED